MSDSGLIVLLDKFGINVPLLCIQVVNFILVAYLLYRFGFRNVLRVMDERNKRISDGLEYAKKMEAELGDIDAKRRELISEANSQASEIVNSAKNHGTELVDRQRTESKKIAEDMLSKAQVDIAKERQVMFSGLKSELKGLVIEAAQCALQRELSTIERDKYGQHAAEILMETTQA
ncbi:MAG: F0F1 ATP synthase subunit B [Puniceicoccales bacterium]|jgi:F-type H+-transporting ATPase subunit b|nr:F0F1 ATP synthase subunit B [Puniceicoccales bacterium]